MCTSNYLLLVFAPFATKYAQCKVDAPTTGDNTRFSESLSSIYIRRRGMQTTLKQYAKNQQPPLRKYASIPLKAIYADWCRTDVVKENPLTIRKIITPPLLTPLTNMIRLFRK